MTISESIYDITSRGPGSGMEDKIDPIKFYDTQKVTAYLNSELQKLFPGDAWYKVASVSGTLRANSGYDIKVMYIANPDDHLAKLNSPFRIDLHSSFVDGGGRYVAKDKITFESWGHSHGGLKFRKITAKTLMDASKKVIVWMKKWKASTNVNEATMDDFYNKNKGQKIDKKDIVYLGKLVNGKRAVVTNNKSRFSNGGDPYSMWIADKDNKVLKHWGTHPKLLGARHFLEKRMDESLDEASPGLVGKVKQALNKSGIHPDQVSKDKQGNVIIRKGFFYRNGNDSDKETAKVLAALKKTGIGFELVDSGEKWKAFRGGATLANSSHWYTTLKINEADITESTALLDKYISQFSRKIKSSKASHTTYKNGGQKIHNMKYVTTESDINSIFNALKAMGFKKPSGWDSQPDAFNMFHDADSMISRGDPVHHPAGISAHVEAEHGEKLKVHFLDRNNIEAEDEVKWDKPATGVKKKKKTKEPMNKKGMELTHRDKSEAATNEEGTSTASIPTGPESVGIKPDSKFGQNAVFDCDNSTFSKCIKGKKKGGHWSSHIGRDNPLFKRTQDWMAQSAKNKNFLLRNASTGEMAYARKFIESKVDEMESIDRIHMFNITKEIFKVMTLDKLNHWLSSNVENVKSVNVKPVSYDYKKDILGLNVRVDDLKIDIRMEGTDNSKKSTWTVKAKGSTGTYVMAAGMKADKTLASLIHRVIGIQKSLKTEVYESGENFLLVSLKDRKPVIIAKGSALKMKGLQRLKGGEILPGKDNDKIGDIFEMKSYKEFLNEISAGVKIAAFGEMDKMAMDMKDQLGDFYGPDGTTVKLYQKRANVMLAKIRKQHGDKVAELAKDKFLKNFQRSSADWEGDHFNWRIKKFANPKVMKGGPRKGKLSPEDIEKRKRIMKQDQRMGR